MHLNSTQLVAFIALAIGPISHASAQRAIDQLQPLVAASASRLLIAEQVAFSKWDSGTAVEDTPREAQVIRGAVQNCESKGLDQTFVSNFFKAQIEANKVVQYFLLAEWHRAGVAPDHPPINLANTIRPELDQIQTTLIAELARTAAIRASATCHTDVAKAVGEYLSIHKLDPEHFHAVALDRAMAAACTH
jgi:chorismate mutase